MIVLHTEQAAPEGVFKKVKAPLIATIIRNDVNPEKQRISWVSTLVA